MTPRVFRRCCGAQNRPSLRRTDAAPPEQRSGRRNRPAGQGSGAGRKSRRRRATEEGGRRPRIGGRPAPDTLRGDGERVLIGVRRHRWMLWRAAATRRGCARSGRRASPERRARRRFRRCARRSRSGRTDLTAAGGHRTAIRERWRGIRNTPRRFFRRGDWKTPVGAGLRCSWPQCRRNLTLRQVRLRMKPASTAPNIAPRPRGFFLPECKAIPID